MSGDVAFSPSRALREIVAKRDTYAISLQLCSPWIVVSDRPFPEFLRPIAFAVAGRREAFKAHHVVKMYIHLQTFDDFTLPRMNYNGPRLSRVCRRTGWQSFDSFTSSLYGYLVGETLMSDRGQVAQLCTQSTNSSFYSGSQLPQLTFEEVLQVWPLEKEGIDAICGIADERFPD